MRSPKILSVLLSALLATFAFAGCDPEEPEGADAGSVRSDAGRDAGEEQLDPDGGQTVVDAGRRDAGFDPDAACVSTEAEATVIKKPVDIVFIIDNSASMDDEIEAVQNNLNANFANIIGASDIDYRVIVIGLHGPTTSGSDNLCRICVKQPLSTTSCSPIPAQPGVNPPIFFHYNVEIASHDSVCKLLSTLDRADTPFGLAPQGWQAWLRPEAHKHFVELSDDGLNCRTNPSDESTRINDYDEAARGVTAAQAFDAKLLAKSPAQFGTAAARKYTWHSIINVAAKADPTQAYGPTEPIKVETCYSPYNEGPGTGYQELSRITGGLRFPICEHASYDAVFREIARGVIEGAVVDCEYPVPQPPPGKQLDLSTVVIGYTPGGGGAQQIFGQVSSPAQCAAGRFYIENQIIKLCPATCSTVQADDAARVVVLYGCHVELN